MKLEEGVKASQKSFHDHCCEKFRRVRNCLNGVRISVKTTINVPTVVYQGPNYSYFP